MRNRKPDGPVVDEIRAIVEPRGYALVAFSSEIVNRRLHVHCVLHHPEGVELDTLAEMHRALEPRIEMLLDHEGAQRDARVEFSSPGITRTFASFHEFDVFRGKVVEILPVDTAEWVRGTIVSADSDSCLIRFDSGAEQSYTPDSIGKARLTE